MSVAAAASRPKPLGISTRTLNRIVIYGLLAIFALFYLMPLFVMRGYWRKIRSLFGGREPKAELPGKPRHDE